MSLIKEVCVKEGWGVVYEVWFEEYDEKGSYFFIGEWDGFWWWWVVILDGVEFVF